MGCSVAVRWHDDRVFLLTANHVLERFERREFHAWTPAGFLLLQGRVAASELNPHRFAADSDDAAVFEFDPANGDVFEWIRQHALSPSQLDERAVCRSDEFFSLVGFPSNHVGRIGDAVVPNVHMWVGFTETHSFDQVKLSPDRHVALEWNNAVAHSFPIADEDRRVTSGQGRSFGGVSGSPIVILGNRDGPTTVSAIFTDYRNHHLVGTSVRVHREYITELLRPGSNPAVGG